MQALLDLVAGFLTGLAALAFSQFGVSLHAKTEAKPAQPEIHRTAATDQTVRRTSDSPAPAAVRVARPV